MKLFDCNCHFGKTAYYDPGSFYEKEVLLKKMNQYNIEKALVFHSKARDYSPIEGNKLLLDEISSNDNLLPVFVVLPNHTGEFMEMQQLDKKVKAIRMFPSIDYHFYSLKDYACQEIYEFAGATNLPIMIDSDEISYDLVDEILSNHVFVKLIITNTGYRADRHLYPLMKKHKNLFIDTCRYSGHQGVETFVNTFGSERILFGSGMPKYSGSGGVYFIEKLMLPDKDKENIAYNNINNLMKGVSL